MDLKPHEKSKVAPIDSVEHAHSVIKSLRSSSQSQKRYQRIAENDDFIQSLAFFDNIVFKTAAQVAITHSLEEQMNSAIAREVEPVNAKVTPFQRQPISAHSERGTKEEDMWSDDEESISNKTSAVKFDHGSDDDNDERTRPQVQPLGSKILNVNSSVAKMRSKMSSSADFSDPEFSDDEDNDELFKGFVAPKTSGTDGRAQLTSSRSAPPTAKISGIGVGTATLKDFSVSNTRVTVKPGQRIRVRASGGGGGGRSKLQSDTFLSGKY